MKILNLLLLFDLYHSNYCSGQGANQTQSQHNFNNASCGLFKIESGVNIYPTRSFDGYLGLGVLTLIETDKNFHFILGTAGIKAKTLQGQFYCMPQFTIDYPVIVWSIYSKINIWCPIKSQEIDVMVTPQIGYAFALGFGYVTLGYDINTTKRLNFQNSFNLNLGINLPPKLTRVIENI